MPQDEVGHYMIMTKRGGIRERHMKLAILRMWMTAAKKVRKEKQKEKEASKDRKETKTRQAMEMEEAEACNNTARMWEIMRAMGGTNRGPRRRKLDVPLTEYPDAEEWLKHLQQEGKNGGCKAELIEITEIGRAAESIQLEKKEEDKEDDETEERRQELFTQSNILKQFKEGKMAEEYQKEWREKKHGKC